MFRAIDLRKLVMEIGPNEDNEKLRPGWEMSLEPFL